VPLWRPTAIADRKKITAYIAQDNPQAAIEMGDMLFEKAQLLDEHPKLGRVGRVKGTRELVAHPNYILIYRIVGEVAEVLRVKHAAQKWP
jgi:toxin ParE1/3/4